MYMCMYNNLKNVYLFITLCSLINYYQSKFVSVNFYSSARVAGYIQKYVELLLNKSILILILIIIKKLHVKVQQNYIFLEIRLLTFPDATLK